MSTTNVYRYEVDPVWKGDVDRLVSECKKAPGQREPTERLRDYLLANRGKAIIPLPARDPQSFGQVS